MKGKIYKWETVGGRKEGEGKGDRKKETLQPLGPDILLHSFHSH